MPGEALLRVLRTPPCTDAAPDGDDPGNIDWTSFDWRETVALARFHRLGGWLAVRLERDDRVPEAMAAALRAIRAEIAARQLRMEVDLAEIISALDNRHVTALVVKGPVLAQLAYGSPEERDYGDLDLLVSPESLDACLEALEAAGGRLLDRNWPLVAQSRRGELSVAMRHDTALDVHWSLLNTPRLRATFSLDTDALLDRAVEVGGHPLRLRTLDKVDTLVYVALHAVLAGAHQLGWLLDVSRLAGQVDDWHAVVARAESMGAALPLAVALARAGAVIGPTPSAAVLDDLTGGFSPWLDLCTILSSRRGSEWVWRGRSGRSLISCTRSDSRASMAMLTAFTASDLTGRLRGQGSGSSLSRLRMEGPEEGYREVFLASIIAESRDNRLARCKNI